MGKREMMRSKLDAWLGKSFKASKLKSLLNLTVSRLAVLRNQRRARCDLSRRDVAELLRQGHQERALLRAEYVIKEQNMLDAFAMVESYCHVVTERAALLENQKDCPDELREAIAGLIFAESRCGDLPELHEVRSIFASRLGKEFVASAVELRSRCGVNSRIIQKLSTKPASLESRVKATRDIAAELGIDLHLDEPSPEIAMEENKLPQREEPNQPLTPTRPATVPDSFSPPSRDEYLSESVKMRQQYKDAASAAQAAFESAAFAAAAARAAVELSRSESQGKGSFGDQSPRIPAQVDQATGGGPAMEKLHPVQAYSSDSESDEEVMPGGKPVQRPGEGKYASPVGYKTGDDLTGRDKRIAYDTSEEEDDSEGGDEFMGNSSMGRSVHGAGARRQFGVTSDEDTSDEEVEEVEAPRATFRRQSPARQQRSWEYAQQQEVHRAGFRYGQEEEEQEKGGGGPAAYHGERSRVGNTAMDAAGGAPVRRLGVGKGPVSMRTRRSGF